jgi:hypothetical protein
MAGANVGISQREQRMERGFDPMIKTLRVVGLAALIAAPAVRLAIPASTHTSRSAHIGVVIVDGVQTAKVPSVRIVGEGLTAHFKPDSVSAGLSSSSEPCTASDESMTVTNKSSLDQDVIEAGSDFVNLPPGSTAVVCLYANGSSSFVFDLANAHISNTLDVAVS